MIRAETRAALATAVTSAVEALGGVVCRWPVYIDPPPTRVTFVVTGVDGQVSVPTFDSSSALRASDTWRIDVYCRAEASLQTTESAEQLAQDMASAVIGAVHADSDLSGLTKSAGAAGTWRFGSAVVVNVDGPEIVDYSDGPAAVCAVTIECTATIYR